MVSQNPGRLRFGIVIGEVVGHGVFGGHLDPWGNDFREKRTSERSGGNGDEQRVEDGAANIGMVDIDREQSGRMRRDKAVIDRKRSDQRQSDANQRGSGSARDGEGDGDEQYEADFEECGQADDEADHHHGPGQALFAEDADQRERDGVGAAGFGHHLAEHGAESDHDGDVAEGVRRRRFRRSE